jgi:type III pantothenate kinase
VLHQHHLEPRWRALEARIAARADAVITVSEHSKAALLDAGVAPERVRVVLQGIDPPPPTAGRAEAWPRPDGLRLLSLGRLEPRKHPEVAIDALAELTRDGTPASLVLAGEGPLRAELLARAGGLGVADRVRLVGRVSESEKWRLYDTADVLLFASTLEGFGLVVAEAQARGVPVIAAAGTATAEALVPGSTGLLADPSAPAFARAVTQLAEPERRRAMAERAATFARRFEWETCTERVAEIYRDLAAGG